MDGVYDWDADGEPHQGSAGVDAMLQGDGHQGLIARGVGHFAGPLLIELDGERATALNYSLIMRREEDRFFLWRVSAVRWDVERVDSSVAGTAPDQPAARRVGRRSADVR